MDLLTINGSIDVKYVREGSYRTPDKERLKTSSHKKTEGANLRFFYVTGG